MKNLNAMLCMCRLCTKVPEANAADDSILLQNAHRPVVPVCVCVCVCVCVFMCVRQRPVHDEPDNILGGHLRQLGGWGCGGDWGGV